MEKANSYPQNIYCFAFTEAGTDDLGRVHGTDERASEENLENLVRFYIHLIRNLDEG